MVRRVKTKDVVERLGNETLSTIPLKRDDVYWIVDHHSLVKKIRFMLREYIQGTEK